jgi:sec-independent protein translocase protein TatC
MSEIQEITKHLDELRSRILRIVIVVGIITVFILTFHFTPFEINGIQLYYPTLDPINNIAAQITNLMKQQLIPDEVQLIQTAPGQAFFAQIYIAALAGIVFGMPVIIREMTGFIKPALKEREIHVSRAIALPTLGLFIVGCLFSYVVVVPYILDFLYKYGEASGIVTFLNIIDFVSFVLQFLLAFGLSFQLPLIMYAVTASGIIDSSFWRKNIRYTIVVIVIFGAVITPDGSGITMWFIAGPMFALYVAGMFFVERKERNNKKLKN